MDRDQRFGERDRVSRVESGIPLSVFRSEPDDDDIRFFDQGLVADPVDPRPFVIFPEGRLLFAENIDTAMVNIAVYCTDVSETGRTYFFIGAKSSKILDFGSKFQINTEIVPVDEFHRNRCQNEALGLNFQEKF